jgi:hypothetical protein
MITKKEKPVVRWVIGPCHKSGFDVLNLSITKFIRLYKDRFKYVICHNQISSDKLTLLPLHLVDEVFDQRLYSKSLNIPPPDNEFSGSAWKLYPPRLYQNCHELLIDNDLVIYRKVPEIEDFLNSKDLCIITEAFRRNYQGKFENFVKLNFKVNSGFVGLPPNFNYALKIQEILKASNYDHLLKWETHFEEQSIVASILQKEQTKIIPLTTIQVNGPESGNKIGLCGTHFTGTNKGFSNFFEKFKSTIFF